MGGDNPINSKAVPYPILFFDGECALCNKAAQLLIDATLESNLHFGSLQGKTAQGLLGTLSKTTNSLMYWEAGVISFEKEAIVNTLKHSTRAGWKTIGKFIRILPTPLVNKLYQWVAINRFNLFGKTECWIVSNRFVG
jgi:predicted DCC family thiol-disulfide oxidoreductase YuxK